MKMETAILGAGSFWYLDAVFRKVRGVHRVTTGYSGGKTENPTYQEVKGEKTGHAEVIELQFDANLISYSRLLDIFFRVHDPTALNKQGDDVGMQYRTIIFYCSQN